MFGLNMKGIYIFPYKYVSKWIPYLKYILFLKRTSWRFFFQIYRRKIQLLSAMNLTLMYE